MADRQGAVPHTKKGTIHQAQYRYRLQSCSQKTHHLVAHLAHSYHRENDLGLSTGTDYNTIMFTEKTPSGCSPSPQLSQRTILFGASLDSPLQTQQLVSPWPGAGKETSTHNSTPLVQDGIYDLCAGKSPHVLHPVPWKFSQYCLWFWNGFHICQLDDGPFPPFQARLSSAFYFYTYLLQAVDGEMSLAFNTCTSSCHWHNIDTPSTRYTFTPKAL